MHSLTPADFADRRLKSPRTTLVLFYATWCPFCRRFDPIFDAAEGKVGCEFARADISDEDNPLWDLFRIHHVPTVIAFDRGKEFARKDSPGGIGLFREDLEELCAELAKMKA